MNLLECLEKIFYVKTKFDNEKKYKLYNFLGIKFSVRVKYDKNLYKFVKNTKPKPLKYIDNTIRKKVYVSVVAIFKDEPDIIDWIDYHIKIGVERFYLYDNDSSEDFQTLLKPYIDTGVVVYQKIIGRCMQKPVYKDAIYRFKDETEWLAIIDLDEYIVPVEDYDIKDFLKKYEKYSGVVINWVMFDSNGLKKRPVGKPVIETYTRVHKNYQVKKNKTVKSIVKPRDVRFAVSVHVCIYKKGKFAVDENFNRHVTDVRVSTMKNSVNKIRVNHYHCKSEEDYMLKISKGFADRKTLRLFKDINLNFKDETTNDYVAWKYLDK